MPTFPTPDSELEPLTAGLNDSDMDSKKPMVRSESYHDSPGRSQEEDGQLPDHLRRSDLTRTPSHSFASTNPTYRVYKRRFFGLAQITLLNIIVSWNWLTFAPVSTTSSQYFHVSSSAINWLSTGFLFAFVAASPLAVWTLNRSVKSAIMAASVLMLCGSWIRYGGVRAGANGSFGLTLFGQLVIGLAQAFTLSAPTRYSDLWFTEKGRITATAVASLGNPFGGALGQLINPFWATEPNQIPSMVLYVAVLTTIICLPSFFVPAHPPTPPTPSAGMASEVHVTLPVLKKLYRNPSFHLLGIPFVVYVTAFNATSSLLNQILGPYGFSEDEAGIGGALLIVVGLIAAAISSPLLDRYKQARLPVIKTLVVVIAATYVALIFTPGTRTLVANYVILSLNGAASFSLLPVALELLVEITWGEAGPEVSSTICWSGAQLGGAVLILVMDALKGAEGEPNESLKRALELQAVVSCLAVPLVFFLGWRGLGRSKRLEAACDRDEG